MVIDAESAVARRIHEGRARGRLDAEKYRHRAAGGRLIALKASPDCAGSSGARRRDDGEDERGHDGNTVTSRDGGCPVPLGFLTARDMTSAAGWVCQERDKPCPPALGYPDAEPMTAGRAYDSHGTCKPHAQAKIIVGQPPR
jgi:hypothetical protein